MKRAAFLATLCLAVVAVEVPAAAAPKSEKAATEIRARELFQKGDKDYAEGRYDDALTEFQEAYDLSGRAQLLFNISNALERLGRLPEAVDALEKYLASGKAKDKDVVQKRLANLKKRVEEKKAEDEAAEKKRQEEAQKNATPPAPPPPPPPPPSPPAKPFPILPVALMGAGGASLVAAGVFGILTLGARSDESDNCKDAASGRLCTKTGEDAVGKDKTFGLVTDITLVAGVVLGGVGAYFLLTGKKAEDHVKVGIAPTGRGAAFVGTF
jgi:tetratricopeptide (TPR) repeat protein